MKFYHYCINSIYDNHVRIKKGVFSQDLNILPANKDYGKISYLSIELNTVGVNEHEQ